ncbi:MAG: lamin tail domain-containing protein [Parcubacteria group bacterium]|nr:lamin tail domain-containing protein [Parcubacteria group bacterium]
MNKKTFIILTILCLALIPFLVSHAETNVVINEVAWAGTTDDWRYEWVELFNPSGAVDITEWQIDNGASGNKVLVLSSGTIPSNGYFLICKKEMTGCDLVETKLSLHNEYDKNGKLTLKNSTGNIVDSTPVSDGKLWPGGDNTTKQTMERNGNDWQTSAEPNGTPKYSNSIIGVIEENPEPLTTPEPPTQPVVQEPTPSIEQTPEEQSDKKSPTPPIEPVPTPDPVVVPPEIEYPSNIFINEILPSPEGADAEYEWIELYNANGFEVDLSNWQIRDKIGAVRTFTCPNDTKILSYGFLLLPRTQSNITLQNSGDGLELLNPNQEIIYSIDYPKAPQGQSYSKTEETWKWSTTLTPEKQNIANKPIKAITQQEEQEARPPVIADTKNNQQDSQRESGPPATANIGDAIPKTTKHILTLIFAIIIAVGSGVVVLLLKKKNKHK